MPKKRGKVLYHGARGKKTFKHFDESREGHGATGNIYGSGIYLTDNPKIANFYAKGRVVGEKVFYDKDGVVRRQRVPKNIDDITYSIDELAPKYANEISVAFYDSLGLKKSPPQAGNIKTLSKYKGQICKSAIRQEPALGQDVKSLFEKFNDSVKNVLKSHGYSGVRFDANKIAQVDGVSGTNYVVWDYDLINNPRKRRLEKIVVSALILILPILTLFIFSENFRNSILTGNFLREFKDAIAGIIG